MPSAHATEKKKPTRIRSESGDANRFEPVKIDALFVVLDANVNINLDSTMDIEKLSKQLELLRKYGAI